MKQNHLILLLLPTVVFSSFFLLKPEELTEDTYTTFDGYTINTLRTLYSQEKSNWPKPTLDKTAEDGFVDIGPLPKPTYPKHNPYSEEKVALGKRLFFDPILSKSNQIACASCHVPELGWGDGKRQSHGHNRQLGKRNAPTILNAGHWQTLFWDGRAPSIEAQALFPIQDPVEMNQNLDELVKELQSHETYPKLFKQAFPEKTISPETIGQAIATFERGINSQSNRFDHFVEGKETLLSDLEVEGLHLFRTKARCINCHNTPLFSDNKLHVTGLHQMGRPFEDLGKYNVTQDEADIAKFRTPSLRDVMYTGPWMHNGLFDDMFGIVALYDKAIPVGKKHPKKEYKLPFPEQSELLKPLHLTKREKEAVVAFMQAISSRPVFMTSPL
ncbi:cytochrome-c peroxidase [Limibacter armeniacum]|uniref:cytochrome-c peroxidase n=1 Tax=Limibacter armeniacum TaxID=466084 RepID=UPI002FE63BB9